MHRAARIALITRRGAFPRQCVAVPAKQREATVQLTLALGPFKLIPARAGLRLVRIMRNRVFVQSPPEGVIAVIDLELVVTVAIVDIGQLPGSIGLTVRPGSRPGSASACCPDGAPLHGAGHRTRS